MPDLLQTGNAYMLAPSELSAFRNLLLFQNTDLSTRALTTNDIGSFFAWTDRLSRCYPGAINAKHKSYYDQFFDELCKLDHILHTYVANQYIAFARPISSSGYLLIFKIRNFWHAYTQGCFVESPFGGQYISPGVVAPDHPPQWRKHFLSKLESWGSNPPADIASIIQEYPNGFNMDLKYALDRFTSFPAITAHIASLWEVQWQDLLALREMEDLDNRNLFFLLHLLIGLASSNDEKIADFVSRLVRTHTPTEAYPEETFINQLTYHALLYLGDSHEPDTQYALDNTERGHIFSELQNVALSTMPGAVAIRQSIGRHLQTMHTVRDYPLLDPESNLPLSERKASTRNALLRTLRSVPLEMPRFLKRGLLHGSQTTLPESLTNEERAEAAAAMANLIF